MAAGIGQQLEALGAGGALSAGAALQAPASAFGNDVSLEFVWAEKASRYAEVHMKLLTYVDPASVKLTRFDDYIHRLFLRYFKNVNIEAINEHDFKSEHSKTLWRPFCEHFKSVIDEFNFGTLLRKDCKKDYTEDNCFLVTRIQFFAVEIARNRKGLNKFHLAKETAENTSSSDAGVAQKLDGLKTDDDVDR